MMATMVINDLIYGKIEILDPIIIDLITSKPMQRLKRISQYGATNLVLPMRNISRFDHSVGVWYLAKHFKRSIDEQIASLIHDIPHTAFSHVVDYIFVNDKYDFHDNFLNEVILKSDIPDILKKHGYGLEKLLNREDFPLLDNDLPDISFDRFDYFLRDGYVGGFIPKDLVEIYLKKISIKDETFHFEDTNIAGSFAVLYMNMSRLLWMSPEDVGSYFVLASAIKNGLEKGLITDQDLFTEDMVVLEKLKSSKDQEVLKYIDKLTPGCKFVYAKESEAEFYGKNKPRCVDPYVLKDGELVRVSSLVPSLSYAMQEFKERYQYIGVKYV